MSFDPQPHLKSELIELRPLKPEYFESLFAVASDPLIWQQHPDPNRYKEDVFREFFAEALGSGGALIATDAKSGELIGSSRYYAYDQDKSEVEIGWSFLARSHWGGLYNREMKRLMLKHAFKFVKAVVFLVGPENIRSQKAMEKIGGVRIESRKNAYGRESYVYQISATESWT